MMGSNKQQEVLAFIKSYFSENGSKPTLQQIADGIGLKAVSSVHQYIKSLVDDGLLDKNTNGSYEFSEDDKQEVAILGYIAAGSPIEAIEDIVQAETVEIKDLPKSGYFYALRVKGDSMIDDGIEDGDVVIIRKQEVAKDGEIVVAIIDGNQATLKRIYREESKKRFRLEPRNQSMLPFYRDEVEVRGIVWDIRKSGKKSSANVSADNLRTIDLFAGIGGIRLGFEQAGFRTVFANDFEKACKATYDLNFPEKRLVVEDITKIKADELPEFDFLVGGFPCQAFSIAGYRRGFEDERGRGNLFFDIARILDAHKPTGFLLENVKNLRTHDGGKTFQVIEETLKELGYSIKSKVLNSMDYGNVPQNRERIYIVGFKDHRKTERFEFPEPIKLTTSILDILEKDVDEKYYYNGKPLYDKLKDFVTEPGKVYQWRRQYVRENKKGVSPTLTANMGMGGHNVPIIIDHKGIRKLTPRECARIQGYPDTYQLPKIADSALYKQFGNSVSVPVLKRIAEQITDAF